MAESDSKDFFVTALNNRMKVVRKSLTNAIQSLLDPSQAGRAHSLKEFIREMELLRDVLATSQQPNWIGESLGHAKRALAHVDSSGERSNFVLATELCPAILRHEWNFSEPQTELGFDFDSIYERHRTDCRVPELFDALVESIEIVLQHPEMDSRSAERELNRVIATLKKAKRGSSYVQTILSLNFARSLLKNLVKEYSDKSKIGPAIKAYRKALEETQAAIEQVVVKVQADVDSELLLEVPRLPPASLPRITMRDDSEGEKAE